MYLFTRHLKIIATSDCVLILVFLVLWYLVSFGVSGIAFECTFLKLVIVWLVWHASFSGLWWWGIHLDLKHSSELFNSSFKRCVLYSWVRIFFFYLVHFLNYLIIYFLFRRCQLSFVLKVYQELLQGRVHYVPVLALNFDPR